MPQTEKQYWNRRRQLRWWFYNRAFQVFGRTPVWAQLGPRLW